MNTYEGGIKSIEKCCRFGELLLLQTKPHKKSLTGPGFDNCSVYKFWRDQL